MAIGASGRKVRVLLAILNIQKLRLSQQDAEHRKYVFCSIPLRFRILQYSFVVGDEPGGTFLERHLKSSIETTMTSAAMAMVFTLLARADENGGCTKDTCPVEDSIYGYRPYLSATIIFLAVFAISGFVYLWQGIKTKTVFFTSAMCIGALSEVIGYIAKLLLWEDPFSDAGFKMSVILLTFAPAFYAAGIYYTLKHICLTFDPSLSRLRPALYTYIFISCDVFSIVLQAVGGALSSVADTDSVLTTGKNIMVAGLAFQVFTLVVFGLLAADYAWAVYRHRAHLNPATRELRQSLRFKLFLGALWLSFFCILIRCAYRVAELAGGWSKDNQILRSDPLFTGLESVPITIAAVVLNIWHPGYCFPRDVQSAGDEKLASSSSDENVAQV
nr:sphingoid long-chain base transporter rsb1 [Quercus suber]